MESCDLRQEEKDGISFVSIIGYFSDVPAASLKTIVRQALKQGKFLWVLDFSRCEIMTSPGVASLMEIGLVISDDFQGKLVLCGLDPFKQSVLNLAGVDQVVEIVPGIPEAIKKVKEVQV